MAYAEQQQMVERYGAEALLLLAPAAEAGHDPPRYPEDVDAAAVARALADAEQEVDVYVGAKYDLPLPAPAAILTRLTVDIAAYRLADTGDVLTEERRRRYEDAVALLRRIASGDVSLGERPASARGVVFGRARPRLFGRAHERGCGATEDTY